jgi:hypothetical protein
MRATNAASEGVEAMAMYAGTGVDNMAAVRPAADIVMDLCSEL